ncbi:TonB-dependent receptor [Niastella populi]|uniref:Ferrichrome-iron receptor n=1 Tax=Niastella populi TaxID=550983 RepID=A0A1V9FV16_9BACT|nr:TonB-dependent receptor [Niastella populi]OQP62209.1 ferrichrome-iron receptor [Niastella populi]
MKQQVLLLLLLLASVYIYGQNSIEGKITGENNEPLAKATVTLKQKSKIHTVTSGDDGAYIIADVPNGSYTITISAIGYETLSEAVVLNNGTRSMNFALTVVNTQLQTVEVLGRSAQKYNSDYSFSATKIAMLNRDLPQAIGTVTKELITDRQAFQLADAVKIVPGVIPSSFYNQYAIRGINQNEEGQIINGMRTRQYYFLQPITTNIERVEVIKGPASATFASVDPGGTINLVTKKPLTFDRKEISLSAGSFSTIRGTLDFTGPLNKEKTLLYRLNGGYQEAKSYRDLVRNNSFLLSPSFSYIPDDKTAINVEMVMSHLNGNLDRGQPIFGAKAGADLKSTPIGLNLSAANDFFKSKDFMVTSSLSHRFSDAISFNAAYMKQTWQEDLQEHRTTNAFAHDINNQPVNTLAGMQFVQRKQNWNIDNVTGYFNFKFSTGKIKHQLLAGYDLHRWEKQKGGGQNAARGFLLKDGTVASSFVPANAASYQTITYKGLTLPKPNVSHFDLETPSYNFRDAGDYIMNVKTPVPSALTTTNAVYVQEQLAWNRFILLLSVRHEWFKDITNYEAANEFSFTNNKLLPRVGLTYAITKNINIYGTYLEGFQPQSNTVTLMPNTGSFFWSTRSAAQFKPLTSDLKEVGVKAMVLKGKMQVNAAVYEINQRNLLLNANVPAFPDSLTTRGAERSRGFEIDVAGYLLPNWQINASYSYIDAVIVEDNDEALKGARKQNTPYNSANLWSRFNFPTGSALKDIGIGAGVQYNGDRLPWFSRDFKTPAYTIMDLAVYYSPGKRNIQVACNVNNLFDTRYWIGAQSYLRLFPGAPRNMMLTVTYRF